MNQKKYLFTLFLFLIINLLSSSENFLSQGLSYQIFNPINEEGFDNSEIIIIKINPNFYNINLLSADQYNHENLTVKEWSKKYDLIISINAGMFQEDYTSKVGYMKQFSYINNPYINNYQSIAAFNPKDSTKTKFKIYDIEKYNGKLDNKKIREIISNYNSVIQNLRLIKRPAENRWSQQQKKWSEIALGEDIDGNMLIIFCRSPYSMYDLNNLLLELPIDIMCAQHLEGGPEASLYLKYKDIELVYVGGYETSFLNDTNFGLWKIPNIIGISKK